MVLKNTMGLLVALALVLNVSVVFSAPPSLGLYVTKEQIQIGDSIDVMLTITEIFQLAGFSVTLSFDTRYLWLVTENRPWRAGDNLLENWMTLTNEGSNTKGEASITRLALRAEDVYDGQGTLNRVTFKSLKSGITDVVLDPEQVTLGSWGGSPMEFTSKNVVFTIEQQSPMAMLVPIAAPLPNPMGVSQQTYMVPQVKRVGDGGQTVLSLQSLTALGGSVVYSDDKTIGYVTLGNTTIEVKKGAGRIKVDRGLTSDLLPLRYPVFELCDHLWVPTRDILPPLGFDVMWRVFDDTIIIRSKRH